MWVIGETPAAVIAKSEEMPQLMRDRGQEPIGISQCDHRMIVAVGCHQQASRGPSTTKCRAMILVQNEKSGFCRPPSLPTSRASPQDAARREAAFCIHPTLSHSGVVSSGGSMPQP